MINNWAEVRTAYQVARVGTVSGAAEVLGVHHATVIRHIDMLEKQIGVKLFQRHARGYTPTEAGAELMKVAAVTEDQFTQLFGRIRGQGNDVSGELLVTTVEGVADFSVPMLARFQHKHPDISLKYMSDPRLFKLEYGEAHIAIRGGAKPDDPDNIVQPFVRLQARLCASLAYVEKYGTLIENPDLSQHRFVAFDDIKPPTASREWMQRTVPPSSVVFRSRETAAILQAIVNSVGIGLTMDSDRRHYPDLVTVDEANPDWEIPIWLVSHVDLHRTGKVQALLAFLKDEVKAWK